MYQQILDKINKLVPNFSFSAFTANAVFYRTYSRMKANGTRETFQEVTARTVVGLAKIGQLAESEIDLLIKMQLEQKTLCSGRSLWIGGTLYGENPANFSSWFNCSYTAVEEINDFGRLMDLAAQGVGTGAGLEYRFISQLPRIVTKLNVTIDGEIGTVKSGKRHEHTIISHTQNRVDITVGDSRNGWVTSYLALIEFATSPNITFISNIFIDLSHVRPAGEKLNGFGGTANPVKLPGLYKHCEKILNKALGRHLNSEECCLLIDEAALVIVAGNIRRSAGIRLGDSDDTLFTNAKANLWQQDENGKWHIDLERDALRMANHTRIFHKKPTREECIESVRSQYYSGEGAIQNTGEAIARANADLLTSLNLKQFFLEAYEQGKGAEFLLNLLPEGSDLGSRLKRYGMNPCVTGDTWTFTKEGAIQVQDLVGHQCELYIDGKLFKTTNEGFFSTGVQPVFELETEEGYSVKLTKNHPVLKVIPATDDSNEYLDWCELQYLKPGDHIKLHNHYRNDDNLHFFNVKAHSEKNLLNDNLSKRTRLEFQESCDFNSYYNFIKKLFLRHGQIKKVEKYHFKTVQLELINLDLDTAKATQRMLLRLGIASKLEKEDEELITLIIQNYNVLITIQLLGWDLNVFQSFYYEFPYYKSLLKEKETFIVEIKSIIPCGEEEVYDVSVPSINMFDANGIKLHNCGEIIGHNLHCNLAEVHLNNIDPFNFEEQRLAFKAASISISALLKLNFVDKKYQDSREEDPIVAASFTGLFNFFVKLFGIQWLQWNQAGRPDEWYENNNDWDIPTELKPFISTAQTKYLSDKFKLLEQAYLSFWKNIVKEEVWAYCDRHNLKRPNRYTCVQPAGSKSLLTGASNGWHPPEGHYYIRRITFAKNDPIALAHLDCGFNIIPAVDEKDENGNLLDDIYDPRCHTWLVEFPVEMDWGDVDYLRSHQEYEYPPAIAQLKLYMMVQEYYTTHNTSGTLKITQAEIEEVGNCIYELIRQDKGYVSCAILQRDYSTFPRMPFEAIDKATYDRLVAEIKERATVLDFYTALDRRDQVASFKEDGPSGPAACDSDKCLL